MRIKDLDNDQLAQIITRCEREIIEMKAAQRVGADGVRIFRIKLEATIEKRDALMLRRFRIVFTPTGKMYQTGMVFKLMVGRASSYGSGLNDATIYFRRQRSNGGVQTWVNTADMLAGGGSNTFKVYAFATSDGDLRIEYI